MNKKKSTGFTLIEIMIVIAIVAIIATLALPSFFSNVITVNRKAAIAEMDKVGQQLERAYTNNNGAYPEKFQVDYQPKGYEIEVKIAKNLQSYTVTARAKDNQKKDKCGDLSVDSSGLRTATKSDTANCFR